jgi:hypothetical protein
VFRDDVQSLVKSSVVYVPSVIVVVVFTVSCLLLTGNLM